MFRKLNKKVYDLDFDYEKLAIDASYMLSQHRKALADSKNDTQILHETREGVLYVLSKTSEIEQSKINNNFIHISDELWTTYLPRIDETITQQTKNIIAPFSKNSIQSFNNSVNLYIRNLSILSTPKYTYVADELEAGYLNSSKLLRLIPFCPYDYRADLTLGAQRLTEHFSKTFNICQFTGGNLIRRQIEKLRSERRSFSDWYEKISIDNLTYKEQDSLKSFDNRYNECIDLMISELENREVNKP